MKEEKSDVRKTEMVKSPAGLVVQNM